MPVEIERKFLVDKAKWESMEKPKGNFLRQGYLLNEANRTIRVRVTESDGYLTIKGATTGTSRPEYEYDIPKEEAVELLDNFSGSELSKIRYEITFNGKLWEVDEFLGSNAGLIVAEIELVSEDEVFDLPDWLGKEVTSEAKYYNSQLTIRPFNTWQ